MHDDLLRIAVIESRKERKINRPHGLVRAQSSKLPQSVTNFGGVRMSDGGRAKVQTFIL